MTKTPPKTGAIHYIRAWREERGLTQDEMAERMAVFMEKPKFDRAQLSRIERGKVSLTDKTLLASADALGVELSTLFMRPDAYNINVSLINLAKSVTPEQLASAISLVKSLNR